MGIRTLQAALFTQFSVFQLQLFVVEEGEDTVPTCNISCISTDGISQVNRLELVTVEAVTDGKTSEDDKNQPLGSDSDELEFFRREKSREVTEKLDNFAELEKGMSFKNLDDRRILSYYSIVNKGGLTLIKSDSTRLRYRCDIGYPFVCLLLNDKKGQKFEIKTL